MEVDSINKSHHICLLARVEEEKDTKVLFPGVHGQYFYSLQYFRTATTFMLIIDASYTIIITYRTNPTSFPGSLTSVYLVVGEETQEGQGRRRPKGRIYIPIKNGRPLKRRVKTCNCSPNSLGQHHAAFSECEEILPRLRTWSIVQVTLTEKDTKTWLIIGVVHRVVVKFKPERDWKPWLPLYRLLSQLRA